LDPKEFQTFFSFTTALAIASSSYRLKPSDLLKSSTTAVTSMVSSAARPWKLQGSFNAMKLHKNYSEVCYFQPYA
jgi:hypothetical protein